MNKTEITINYKKDENKYLFDNVIYVFCKQMKLSLTHIGYIYIVKNTKDDMCYIGSTIIDPKIRLAQHITDAMQNNSPTKFHKHIRNNSEYSYQVSTLFEKQMNTNSELLFYEDKYIYEYDTINNGLNSRYNTNVFVKIIKREITLEDKQRLLTEYEDNLLTYCENIAEFNKNNIKILESLQDKKINLEDKYWIKFDMLEFYNVLELDNFHIKIEDGTINYNNTTDILPDDIYGIYLIYWENNIFDIFYKKGGLKKIVRDYNVITFKKNHIIENIRKYGMKFILRPVSYIRTKKTDTTEIQNKLRKISFEIKNITKNFIFNGTARLNNINEIILVELLNIRKASNFTLLIANYLQPDMLINLCNIIQENDRIKQNTLNTKFTIMLEKFKKDLDKFNRSKFIKSKIIDLSDII